MAFAALHWRWPGARAVEGPCGDVGAILQLVHAGHLPMLDALLTGGRAGAPRACHPPAQREERDGEREGRPAPCCPRGLLHGWRPLVGVRRQRQRALQSTPEMVSELPSRWGGLSGLRFSDSQHATWLRQAELLFTMVTPHCLWSRACFVQRAVSGPVLPVSLQRLCVRFHGSAPTPCFLPSATPTAGGSAGDCAYA